MDTIIYKNSVSQKNDGFYFFFKDNYIRYSEFKDSEIFGDNAIIRSPSNNFDVTVDHQNGIHIICQESDHTLSYIIFSDGKWYKKIVLSSEETSKIVIPQLRIFSIDTKIFIIYSIYHENRAILTLQRLTDFSVPQAIDLLDLDNQDFSCAFDNEDNLMIVYTSAENNGEFGTKFYNFKKDSISHFRAIYENGIKIRKSSLLIDSKNEAHLAIIKNNKFVYTKFPLPNDELKFSKPTLSNEIYFRHTVENFGPLITEVGGNLLITLKNSFGIFKLMGGRENSLSRNSWRNVSKSNNREFLNESDVFKISAPTIKTPGCDKFCYSAIQGKKFAPTVLEFLKSFDSIVKPFGESVSELAPLEDKNVVNFEKYLSRSQYEPLKEKINTETKDGPTRDYIESKKEEIMRELKQNVQKNSLIGDLLDSSTIENNLAITQDITLKVPTNIDLVTSKNNEKKSFIDPNNIKNSKIQEKLKLFQENMNNIQERQNEINSKITRLEKMVFSMSEKISSLLTQPNKIHQTADETIGKIAIVEHTN